MESIKVFLIDDSALVRQEVLKILDTVNSIELIGTAADPVIAEKKLKKNWPDVIILDIEMPVMDGLSYLEKIMKERPTPVIICSSFAKEGSDNAIKAYSLGAVEVIYKPRVDTKEFYQKSKESMINAIRAAFLATKKISLLRKNIFEEKIGPDAVVKPILGSVSSVTERIVVIGASTGGVQALERLLAPLSKDSPGIVVVQHMPAGFTASFAGRLNTICQMDVKEAEDGDEVKKGAVLIAPGDKHLLLKRDVKKYYCIVKDGPKISRHRPSVDVLFRSAANEAGKNAVAVLLTGMGDDGAKGMKELYDKGAFTIAQDEKSSIVYGMPKEAVEHGGVKKELPLEEIGEYII